MLGPGGPGPSLVKDQPKARSVRPALTITSSNARANEERPQQPAAETRTERNPIDDSRRASPHRLEQPRRPTFTALCRTVRRPEEARARDAHWPRKCDCGRKSEADALAPRNAARALTRSRRATAAHGLRPTVLRTTRHAPDYAYAPRGRSYGPFSRIAERVGAMGRSGWDAADANGPSNGKWWPTAPGDG